MKNVHVGIALRPDGGLIAAGARVTEPQPGTHGSLSPNRQTPCRGRTVRALVRC